MAAMNYFQHLVIAALFIYIFVFSLPKNLSPFQTLTILSSSSSSFFSTSLPVNVDPPTPTTLKHLIFGLLGSEHAWHYRKNYIESWWRPNQTRGRLYLDTAPTGDLLPWSAASPPYRVSKNLTDLIQESHAARPVMIRMVHGIMELFEEMDDGDGDGEGIRWVVMGDDDSMFFVDNMVDVLAKYDHRKYVYLGGASEFVMSNFWFSFDQGFGGAGFILSYPLAKALAEDMDGCLRRHAQIISADLITMACIADIGVNLTPHKGLHQIDMHGDISGFLSSHPKSPVMSLHHLDLVEPLFPGMDRFDAVRHFMAAAAVDQSRMLQQTICYHRRHGWSLSVAWGYSAYIYEGSLPRFHLQKPLETFQRWVGKPRPPPEFMFNTRPMNDNPCEMPHVFFLRSFETTANGVLTVYSRARPRGLPPCGGMTADFVTEVRVLSPATHRKEMDRAECCDVVLDGERAEAKFRECLKNETIVL